MKITEDLSWRYLSVLSLSILTSSDSSVPYELDYNGYPVLLCLTKIQGPDGTVVVNIETLVVENDSASVKQGK